MQGEGDGLPLATPEEVEGMTVEAAYEAAKSNRDGASGVRRNRTGADHSDSQKGPNRRTPVSSATTTR